MTRYEVVMELKDIKELKQHELERVKGNKRFAMNRKGELEQTYEKQIKALEVAIQSLEENAAS